MMNPDSRKMYRQLKLDPTRHRFHNKIALMLTVVTLIGLVILSVIFNDNNAASLEGKASGNVNYDYDDGNNEWEKNNGQSYYQKKNYYNRWLEEGNDEDDNADEVADDDTHNNNDNDRDFSAYSCHYIYEKAPDPGFEQCNFAKTCNRGKGVWAPWVFCSKKHSTKTLCLIIAPFMIIWMVILFRLLGSTAEDFFSPSLEMFSVKLGLPPRFAGVSLLALGNGAADVSATMSAINGDEENGYKLALGALTGAAMLVGGVVAGMVVIVANGIPCRGALVRDVTALLVTILVVWSQLAQNEIGPQGITLFLSLYCIFVCIVLVADVYHRAVVIPRIAAMNNQSEIDRQHAEEGQANAMAADALNDLASSQSNVAPAPPSALSRVLTAMSNYDNPSVPNNQSFEQQQPDGWGVDSSQLEQEQPIRLHGQNGLLSRNHTQSSSSEPTVPADDDGGAYALVDDSIDRVCVQQGTLGFGASSWSGGWHDCKQEIRDHAVQVYDDIAYDADVGILEKILLCLELPFTVLRKLTVPIPCEGYYNRGILMLAMAFSPLWLGYYIYSGYKINLFSRPFVPYFMSFWLVSIIVAALILRLAPGGGGTMALPVATPIAMYGFVVAATWIDFVADRLVFLLDFLGIILGIPGSIMGLTILAWGNSMGDLSANLTMARKGLANMAMTACFAGPVFNILIGLGLGFWQLAAQTGRPEAIVSLSGSVITGFIFIFLNTASILFTGLVLGKGRIEPYYGRIALALYSVYIITSIWRQYYH